jgi:carbon-monoxide dehydrogenase small subunit
MSISVQLNVNGKSVTLDCPSNTTLVDLLRERLELTGTHVGCDTSQCGACTVHLNGRAVKSCTILAAQCEGAQVTTIEGLGDTDNLHPMQEAFRECHGLQCGFCTPGMIMSAVDLVHREPAINEQVIREGLEGNICRCTGYHNIVLAVESAAKKMRN